MRWRRRPKREREREYWEWKDEVGLRLRGVARERRQLNVDASGGERLVRHDTRICASRRSVPRDVGSGAGRCESDESEEVVETRHFRYGTSCCECECRWKFNIPGELFL